MPKPFYITTTLPYVNGEPHIGFALEIVEADVIARFNRILGNEVFFNTGTDEHGMKIYRKAEEEGKTAQQYVDEMSVPFKNLKELLNISYTNFIRTTDVHHIEAAQEFWRRCEKNGDIYKKEYKTKYCIGCELEKTDSELVDGRCPIHPSREIEIRQEENYFFRFSKYQQQLLDLYAAQPDFVVPEKRMNEIRSFVSSGLNDFSISRLKSKMPWGVPVPGDEDHVMYVWFDALVNYISALGWPATGNFEKFWPSVQIAGKDNLRQQSAMWQAMLLSAGLPHSKQILINGFIDVNGQKMSKDLGNVISPKELVSKYGIDGTRYILLNLANLGDDSDASMKRFDDSYQADLANGLGNLVSRVLKLSEKLSSPFVPAHSDGFASEFLDLMNRYRFADALRFVVAIVDSSNKRINDTKLWELVKTNPTQFEAIMHELLADIATIAHHLTPFLPETSEKIKTALKLGKTEILFPRV